MDRATLTSEILKLPAAERALMIEELWRSLDSGQQREIDAEWLRESEDRLMAYRSGQLEALDGEETLRAKLN